MVEAALNCGVPSDPRAPRDITSSPTAELRRRVEVVEEMLREYVTAARHENAWRDQHIEAVEADLRQLAERMRAAAAPRAAYRQSMPDIFSDLAVRTEDTQQVVVKALRMHDLEKDARTVKSIVGLGGHAAKTIVALVAAAIFVLFVGLLWAQSIRVYGTVPKVREDR
jgi:hypothetical protein